MKKESPGQLHFDFKRQPRADSKSPPTKTPTVSENKTERKDK